MKFFVDINARISEIVCLLSIIQKMDIYLAVTFTSNIKMNLPQSFDVEQLK